MRYFLLLALSKPMLSSGIIEATPTTQLISFSGSFTAKLSCFNRAIAWAITLTAITL
jgi:hypothetical protein